MPINTAIIKSFHCKKKNQMGSLSLNLVEDCMGVLQLFSDGTIFRESHVNFNIPIINDNSVIFKDCIFDKTHNLYLRIYKPSFTNSSTKLLPILYFMHGGGFCVGSRDWPNCHNFCLKLASSMHALVISPDYRLAPEHRLPAAVDDAMEAVRWLQRQALSDQKECDAWLRGSVDFDKVFVLGDSSGGNIAHQLAVRLKAGSIELRPVRVRGYVLMAPFFGGILRTKSEEGPSESVLNLEILDRFWRLSMPVGETRDHPLSNPFGPASPNLKLVALDPLLVIVGGNEIMKDRAQDYAKRLEQLGKKIQYVEFKGMEHGFFLNDTDSEVAKKVLQLIRNFILEN